MYDPDQWPGDAGEPLRRPPERPDISEQADEDNHPDEYPTPKRDDPRMNDATPTPTFSSASDADAIMNVRDAAPKRSDNAGTTGKRTTPNHHDDLDITLYCPSSDDVLGCESHPADQAQHQDDRGDPQPTCRPSPSRRQRFGDAGKCEPDRHRHRPDQPGSTGHVCVAGEAGEDDRPTEHHERLWPPGRLTEQGILYSGVHIRPRVPWG